MIVYSYVPGFEILLLALHLKMTKGYAQAP